MKRLLLLSLLITAAILCIPILSDKTGIYDNAPSNSTKKAERLPGDASRTIRLASGDEVTEISVKDYLVGVVAAEMPASFESEALKAQAVAARSYLQRALSNGTKHESCDICADSGCCQAYKSDAELKELWGDKYTAYIARIEEAVEDTDGEYISYNGEPALAVFHSSSCGTTENSGAVWNELPYLTSVDTPETEKDVPNFVSKLSLSELDFRDTVLYGRPAADMTGEAKSWIGEIKRDAAGRVESIVIGGESFSGSELRSLFSLRSTDFELEHTGSGFVFTVKGYGHGVGMSQYGANIMAKNGADYKEILAHYYPGTVLS
ncbi:MAG: stage II sporulation protein D [Bacillota bacterium]|nr:stage II sporulation protein D [Bacillota bacterium]